MALFRQNAGGRGGPSHRVEIADRELAARERAPLVAVDRRKPRGELGIVGPFGDKLAPGAPRADEIDLGGGGAAGGGVTFRAGIQASDLTCQRLDLARDVGSRSTVSSKP